ncbi:MAG: RNA polymerase factor sigma-54 [Pseudomonadota bacterium]
MSVSLRLDIRQSQSLVMTPQLQQAIKLLQLGNLDLAAYVEQELEQNPFLEKREEATDKDPVRESPDQPNALTGDDGTNQLSGSPDFVTDTQTSGEGWSGSGEDGWQESEREAPLQGVETQSISDSFGYVGRGGSMAFDDEIDSLENRASRPQTLRDHLLDQIYLSTVDGPERLIAHHLIDLVDDDGYLRGDLDDVTSLTGCDSDMAESVLAKLQQCDPSGVCARSLKECLALQLRDLGRFDPAMEVLLDNLELLAKAEIGQLHKICGVLADDIPEMIAEIKALNPKPGQGFAEQPIDAVVPDIFILPTPSGWRVELNTATLPKLIVNNEYHTQVRKGAEDARAKEYVNERIQSANWLIKALDQRARTVLKVTEAVVERQGDFLTFGVSHLRPLVLRDIAEAIEMHESTVSRATADKFVATPRGTYPFKYFFSNALPSADGEGGHAAEAIRQKIKELIDGEKPDEVLSDDQVVTLLRAKGVSIARRTVAKYRESLSIPSSVQRRREKSLKLA